MKSFSGRLVVLARSRLLWSAGLALLVGGPIAFAAFLAKMFPPGALGLHATIVGLILAASVPRQNPRPRKVEHDVIADAEGVKLDGTLVVARSRIATGFFQPRWMDQKYRSSVRLFDKLGNVVFEAEVQDENQALEILNALGLDPSQRRARFRASSPIYATVGRQMLFTFGLVFGWMFVGAAIAGTHLGGIAFFLMFPLLFGAMWPAKLDVGVDGILWKWLFWKKFIPMSDVQGVFREEERGIRIQRKSGKDEVIYAAMRSRYKSNRGSQHRDAIVARVSETLTAYQARTGGADVATLIARGTRTKEEWVGALRKLARDDGGYRDAAVREEDLLRVLEDPGAPEDARAGAALVLKSRAKGELKERVRVAAEATASPKLRVVLDAAANEDDAALEEALHGIEAGR
jgi:hypothetical protein